MKKSAEIWDELQQISAGSQGFGKEPEYGVPEGYFDRLSGEILAKIRAKSEPARELEEVSPLLGGISRGLREDLPDGYFDHLSESILARIRAKSESDNELQELSPILSGISRTMPMELPEGYFAEFGRDIQELTLALAPVTSSSFLETLPRTVPYQVPDNYFESLASRILDAVKPSGVKVFSIRRSVLKYAAAAVIAAFLAAGAGLYLRPVPISVDAQLASLSGQAMEEYLQSPSDALDNESELNNVKDNQGSGSLVSSLSNQDLQSYLDNTVNLNDNVMN